MQIAVKIIDYMSINLAPPVRFDTHQHIDEFFDYCQTEKADPHFTKPVFHALRLIFSPETVFEPELEEQISERLEAGNLLALFMKHHDELDPLITAGGVLGTSLDRLKNGATILAKPVLADNPVTGWFLTKLGISVAVRKQDYNNWRFRLFPEIEGANNIYRDSHIEHLRRRNIGLGAANYDAEGDQASFVEGSRQGKAKRTIEPKNVHLGIVDMARASINGYRVIGLCIAVNRDNGFRRPVVAVTSLIEGIVKKDDETLRQEIAAGVQAADDLAFAEAAKRVRPSLPARWLRQMIGD